MKTQTIKYRNDDGTYDIRPYAVFTLCWTAIIIAVPAKKAIIQTPWLYIRDSVYYTIYIEELQTSTFNDTDIKCYIVNGEPWF